MSMTIWWAIGAALITFAVTGFFVWSLCRVAAEADREASDLHQTDTAPHPRIRLVPRPDAEVVSLDLHRSRRHHPSNNKPGGPVA